jgi:nucleotide-binding universal stress UspA family protein
MQFAHIVVGVDFSEASREAMRAAARLVEGTPTSRLTIAYVWHSNHPYTTFSGDELRAAVESDEAMMAVWKQEAHDLGAEHVSSVFLAGNPADELIELAHKDTSIDLIAVGTHGRTGLAHVLLGSVAEKIVRRAPCAVLAIPAGVSRARSRYTRHAVSASIH